MDNTKLKDFEAITQELRGNLIQSERWNNNFNRVQEVINANNETIADNFDKIASSTIPSPAIEELGQLEDSFVLEQLRLIVNQLIAKTDFDDFEAANAINIKAVDFNSSTGVFTFTRNNETTISFDTALEKVPASFELVENDEHVYLKITNIDGTSTQTDVTSLLNIYTFKESDTVAPEGAGYDYSFRLKENSVSENHLSPSVMQSIKQHTAESAASAESANTSAANASASEKNANEYKNQASLSAQSAAESAEAANLAKNTAVESANNASISAGNASRSASDASLFADRAEEAASDAETAKQAIEDMTVSAKTLPAGSQATVTKTISPQGTVNLSFGLVKGDKGDTGVQGIQGPQGVKGETGATGPQGDVGPAGPQGVQGEAGPEGAVGTVGPKGDKGETGATGPQGAVGPKGETGSAGVQGEVGPVGPQGPQGERGPAGPVGPQGPQGERGINGVAVSSTGTYAFNVNENGELVLMYTGDEAPAFSINEDGELVLAI